MNDHTDERGETVGPPVLADRLVQRSLLLTSQVLGWVIGEGECLSHGAVHDIRVATKQLRAAWRLLKHAAPVPAAEARTRLRDVHHLLAAGRRQTALRGTLEALLVKARNDGDRAALQELLDALPMASGVQIGLVAAAGIGGCFRAESQAWRQLALGCPDAALCAAVTAGYRRARRSANRARRRASATAHHRLRRRVKGLLYQADLLFDPPLAGASIPLAALARVAAVLGEVQDLSDLQAHAVATVANDEVRRRVSRLLQRRIANRIGRADKLSAVAFAMVPARFAGALAVAVPVDPAPAAAAHP